MGVRPELNRDETRSLLEGNLHLPHRLPKGEDEKGRTLRPYATKYDDRYD